MEWPKLVEAWERDIAPASRAVPSRLGAIVVFVVLCLLVFVCVLLENCLFVLAVSNGMDNRGSLCSG